MSYVVPLLAALIGGAIAFLSAWFILRREMQRERRRHLLSKLEETHGVAGELKEAARPSWKDYTSGRGGYITIGGIPMRELSRMRMLVAFYFPELRSSLSAVESALSDFRDVYDHLPFEVKHDEHFRKVLKVYEPLHDLCDSFQERVASIVNRYL